jgi:uncharacterized repeat protein (TIGR03803 family)
MRARFAILTAAFAVASAFTGQAEAGTAYKTLHAFCGRDDCADGSKVMSAPVLDASGALYGTTDLGGANDYGTFYKLVP